MAASYRHKFDTPHTYARRTGDIIVYPSGPHPHGGMVHMATHRARCALGARGVTHNKKEGDRQTPVGRFALRRIWYRPDRVKPPVSSLPIREIQHKSGWSDDIAAADYNRPVTRPYRHRHEVLWRHDRLYDLFIELGVNDAPVMAGAGSAIFLHLAKNNYQATLGCVAIARPTMDFILRHAQKHGFITILDAAPKC